MPLFIDISLDNVEVGFEEEVYNDGDTIIVVEK